MKNTPFLAVEGPIGVGKTTLTKAISEKFGIEILKEIVEENPFLENFYDDLDEWSFQTEMFFLCNRYKQLNDINKNFLENGKAVVSDYHIFKNTIFAKGNLKEEEFNKYMKVYNVLNEELKKPNMVIFLNASLDTLKKRISFRGRSFEENIKDQYLLNLSKDYENYMNKFIEENPEIPVLYFDGDRYDFVNNENDLKFLLDQIEHKMKSCL